MITPGLALRVARGYRATQLVGRVRTRVRRQLPFPPGSRIAPPPLHAPTLAVLGDYARSRYRDPGQAERLVRGGVLLVGRDTEIPRDGIWESAGGAGEDLWRFHLHYHEYLVALLESGADGHARASAIISSWLKECPPSAMGLALPWHPYVISCRLVPWAALIGGGLDRELSSDMTGSLWQQVHTVAGNLERDVGGNHLLRNAKALAVGGALFTGPDADRLRQRGQSLVRHLLEDQLRTEGAHVELSPSYHALVLEDVLDTVLTARPDDNIDELRRAASAMIAWLLHVSPPNQARPHLNDCADGMSPETAFLAGRCADLNIEPSPARVAPGTPRYRVFGDDRTRLLLDAAPPARDDLPYHAHADSLGIVVDIDGVPLIVDRGVAEYAPGPGRAWWRSTAAHSTVQVDNQDTSEMVGAFRAGRLARTEVLVDERDRMCARVDGGRSRSLEHIREVRLDGPGSWSVIDRTPGAAHFVSRLHFAPGTSVTTGTDSLRAHNGGASLDVRFPGGHMPTFVVSETPHAISMGVSGRAVSVEFRTASPRLEMQIAAG